jgi:hypothetical protein
MWSAENINIVGSSNESLEKRETSISGSATVAGFAKDWHIDQQ